MEAKILSESSQNTIFRVLIIEDDPHIRERLVNAVNQHPQLTVCADSAYFEEGRTLLDNKQPDVLLTDLGLPDGNGVELIQYAQQYDNIESIVITVFGDEYHLMNALEAGASGYLLKNSDIKVIGHAIIEMLEGGSPMSPSIARTLIKKFQAPRSTPEIKAVNLTDRELEVLNYSAKGLNYNQISDVMGISYHTVSTHVKHIYRKLQVNSRSEAVYEAEQLGLIRLRE